MAECSCAFCQTKIEFNVPRELLERIADGRCVIFAGAGISTENRLHCKSTFYEQIRDEAGVDQDLDFPSLMSVYCRQPDGRIKLIQRIRERIEYFRSFRGFYRPMTAFHRALRPLFMINDVITTNWDDFLEVEAGFVPFVYDQDIPFIESSNRRVIKIHGSITNFGSIVATSEDYSKALRRLNKGALGAYLKTILSTKTIVYIGYSLRDQNYLKLAQSISRLMGQFSRSAYFVSPYIDDDYLKSTKLNIIPIKTDGSYFLEQIRLHHNATSCDHKKIIGEEAFERAELFLIDVNEYHTYTAEKFRETNRNLLILALSYQDGLQDALMRIKDMRNTGVYYNSEHILMLAHGYERKVESYLSNDNFWDACYCRGYQNGLLFLLEPEQGAVPPMVDVCFDDNIYTTPKAMKYPYRNLPNSVKEELQQLSLRLGESMIPEHLPYV
ncbi:SIR2 family protein [Ensifer sp. NPDC090286]|uniref:SIR2 family protein n=1 Tax=Ensifer sp. NPDC090286 TaxID=3363991 RepID=UPI00383B329B